MNCIKVSVMLCPSTGRVHNSGSVFGYVLPHAEQPRAIENHLLLAPTQEAAQKTAATSALHIDLLPNPSVNGVFQLKANADLPTDLQWQVWTPDGKRVNAHYEPNSPNGGTLTLTNPTNGVYVLHLNGTDMNWWGKVMVF